MSRVIDEHRQYLRDRVRVAGYARALAEVVRAGDVVVDLASGTGVLGMLACRAGAARVYAIEAESIAGLARSIAEVNGLGGRITIVRGHSQHVSVPELADVVVCDQIGQFGLEAGIVEYFADARRRLLKPGGRMVPSAIRLQVAPVEHDRLWQRIRFWERPHAGLRFDPARTIAANSGYPVHFAAGQVIGAPAFAHEIPLTADAPLPLRFSVTLTVARRGELHGIGGWFDAQLSPSVTITNSPLARPRIRRRQVFFPIDRPVGVAPGDSVDVAMTIWPANLMFAWDVTVRAAGAETVRFRHATLRGMLIDPADLRRTAPDYRPRLTSRGEARLTVLRLCDGRRPLRDIERAVFDTHRGLFSSEEEAGAFVAEVVTRYSTDGP